MRSRSPELPETPVLEGAGFGIRAVARIIDTGIHFVVGLVTGAVVGLVVGLAAVLREVPPEPALDALADTGPLGYLAAMTGSVLMHTASEGLHGSTLGKRVCGLIVISAAGTPASLTGALKRSIAYFLDALFFGLIAKAKMDESPRRQRYGDVWGGTQVVRISVLDARARPSWVRFALAAMLGLVLNGTILFIELATRLL